MSFCHPSSVNFHIFIFSSETPHPQAILVSDWPIKKIFSSEIARPFIDASYQVSLHLAKWVQRRRFKKINQSETSIACGGHVC
jgi:galactokinase/mevalonate kinase-like predicted kinase